MQKRGRCRSLKPAVYVAAGGGVAATQPVVEGGKGQNSSRCPGGEGVVELKAKLLVVHTCTRVQTHIHMPNAHTRIHTHMHTHGARSSGPAQAQMKRSKSVCHTCAGNCASSHMAHETLSKAAAAGRH